MSDDPRIDATKGFVCDALDFLFPKTEEQLAEEQSDRERKISALVVAGVCTREEAIQVVDGHAKVTVASKILPR